ncbi:unnamed protein product [Cochlearia groenlandica]
MVPCSCIWLEPFDFFMRSCGFILCAIGTRCLAEYRWWMEWFVLVIARDIAEPHNNDDDDGLASCRGLTE